MVSNTYEIGSKTITMSFGLLAECAGTIGDPTRTPSVAVDDALRTSLLRSVLSDRDASGKITQEFNAFACPYTAEQIIALLDWVAQHVLDFFLNALQVAEKRAQESETKIKALTPSTDGSKG